MSIADCLSITPPYSENYEHHWPINVKGRIILDLGADYGSTAEYFLRKGAARVICVEGNPSYYRRLQENLKYLPNCIAIYKYLRSPGDFVEVLANYADVVKVDVEGAEKYLLGVERPFLLQHEQWIIELHRNIDKKALINHFEQVGFYLINKFNFAWGLTVVHFSRNHPMLQKIEKYKDFFIL